MIMNDRSVERTGTAALFRRTGAGRPPAAAAPFGKRYARLRSLMVSSEAPAPRGAGFDAS